MWSSPFIIPVVAIVGGLMVGGLSRFFSHKEKMRKLDQSAGGDAAAQLADLRARIEVLEALATDSKEQLRREIDRL